VVLLATLVPVPAQAHPFGAPQTVELRLQDENVVRAHWQVRMKDDLSWLALYLRLIVVPPERISSDGSVVYADGDAEPLETSETFDRYLLDHLTVSSDGGPCTGALVTKEHVADQGAVVDFTCDGPVSTAVVDVSMLTDIHRAYKTMATGPRGQMFAYDADHPSHEWAFDASGAATLGLPDLGASALSQLSAVGGALVVAVSGGVLWLRRRTRKAAAPA